MDNYIDNVCIRNIESENTSETPAGLPPNAKVTNPDGTRFELDGSAIKIEHQTGSWGADFLQYDFSPMQDVVMEFDAKLGDLNNTDYSLLVESDGGMQTDGLCLAFCQNYLQMYTGGGFEVIATVDFNKWNYYRVVSTATEIHVYVNGVLKKTLPGTFATRSFIRFANSGRCNPVNYIANVRVTALASWDAEWYLNNLDTKPPILSGVWPANNTNLTTANITVGGRISDAFEVTVSVNGVSATIAYGQFSASISLNQGANQLTIIAQDATGNTTQLIRTVQVDSILPAEFTPVADPVSWSTNTQPVITFGTTDDGSGIHHYELLLDDVLVDSSVTSPYQFSMVPDGEHTVKINAVDGFGNTRTGQVKVYVDTTPPGQPQFFRVVPGNGKISLRWTAPDPDVIQYRIVRTPAWTETFRSTDQTELVDSGLENGAQYQYTIWAIDHAQNEGPAAESRQGTVGLAEAEYVPAQGVIVEYDNVTLFVHPESLPEAVESIKITQIESQDMAVKSIYPIVSPIYRFSVTAKAEDASRVEVEHIAFEKDFQGMLAYDPALLPEGYPEKNLGVYYFDPMWGRWFKIEKSGVDTVHHQILFSTNHFTSLSVQPTMIEDLSPQLLKDVGYSPFKTQITHQGITVSPEGGSAMTEMTELVLPGRNGFDFVLKRIYDTATACGDAPGISQNASLSISVGNGGSDIGNAQDIADQILNQGSALPDLQLEALIKKYFQNNGDYCYSMGLGWRLNLPYIRSTNSSVLVRLPSGGFYSIYQMKIINNDNPIGAYRTLTMENHEGEDFTFIVTQARLDINFTSLINNGLNGLSIPGWQLISAKLILKDGTTYEMDALGRTTKITDPTGLNTINLSYGGPVLYVPGYSFGLHLDNITDSMGRKIKFEYDQRFLIPKIKRIWLENDNPSYHREINYTLESALGGGQSVVPLLKKARDVNNREWNYQYDNQLFFNGGISVKVNIVAVILDIITDGKAGKIMGVDDITLSGHQQLMWVFPLSEAQGPGIGRTRIFYDKKTLSYITGEQADYFLGVFPTAIQISYDLSQRIYANRIEIYKDGGGAPVQTVNYDYQVSYYTHGQFYTASSMVDNGRTRITYYYKPFTKRRNRWLDWSDYLAEQSNREIAGLQSGSYAAGCFSENPFNYDALSYNTASVICDSQTGLNFESNQTTDYDMDTLRPLTQVTMHGNGSNSRRISYRFDGWGNLVYQEDVSTSTERTNQTKTWMYYWPNQPGTEAPWQSVPFAQANIEKPRYNLPLGKIVANYTSAGYGVQNVIYLQTNYQYNPLGQQIKSAQWDGGKWLITQLNYDSHGNLAKKTDPAGHETVYIYDEQGNFPTAVTEKAVRDAQGNTRDITARTGYEFISGWKLWQQDPRGYVTEYRYDALGRTTQITGPDDDDPVGWIPSGGSPAFRANNPTTMISYNDTGLYSVVTDPELNQAKYQFDNLGRLEQLIKYRIVNGMYVPAATTRLTYNNWGDISAITDPNGKTTRYRYDAMGRNISIQYPDNEGRNPVKRMDYDYSGDILTITDENGKMSYEYHDVQGRIYKKKLTSDNMDIVSEAYYDGLGNEVMGIDPKGGITTKTYNQLNQLVRIDPPAETFRENGVSVTVTPYQRFTYNDAGFKIAETHALAGSGTEIANSITVDELGRAIRTTTPFTDRGVNKEAVTEIYYDNMGNKIKVVDANNTGLPVSQQKASLYEYSAANLLLSETDPAGNMSRYTYDKAGNRISMTDPRGNSGRYTGDFTILYHYDDLNRLVRGELPAAPGQTVKPEVNLIYDVRGNLLERWEPDGAKTIYTYTARNKVATETTQGSGKSYTIQHRYDLAGNEIEITDARGNTVTKEYNQLNQVKRISYPETQGKVNEYFRYDENGNKVEYINGLSVATNYKYDRYNHLIEVQDGKNGVTSYQYDRWGNMTRAVNAAGHTTNYQYDELNRMIQETDPQGYVKQYGYDLAGNRLWSIDPNGTRSEYQYTANNLVSQVMLQNGVTAKEIYYLYDEAGFRKWVKYGDVITEYNTTNGSYVPDPYGRIHKETKSFEGQSFTVGYDYDVMGRLTQITYPTGQTVDYQYNNLGQLQGVPGFVNETPVYDQGGFLTSIKAANGVTTSYSYDQNGRLTNLSYSNQSNGLKSYQLTYDGANNIVKKNDDIFRYDALNQLLLASIKGNFENNPDEKGPDVGRARDDFKGQRTFEFELTGIDLTELDYAAGCIGVDLGAAFKITRLELQPNSPVHRVTNKKSIRLYYSQDNTNFTRITDWKMAVKQNGGVEITLNTPVTARYFKVKSMHDERNFEFEAVNQAEFANAPQDLIRIYYLMPSRQEEYTYDTIGNRVKEVITQRSPVVWNYIYCPNSSRLQSNEKYRFEYDANGNLTKKETLIGPSVIWRYTYDLFNRLLKVTKDGQTVAEYMYDEGGLRIKKTGPNGENYYVFDSGGNVLYEQENREYMEYIYVLGKHFARVDGNLDNSITKKYFYHTDYLGSTVLVTDEAGQKVWASEYTPFGKQVSKEGELDGAAKFTGKDLDEDTGLYYFNARWMDSETGRFITEDPAQDGTNWYTYGVNNPLTNTDPTGMVHQNENGEWVMDDSDFQWNEQYGAYNFWVNNDEFFSYGSQGYWWNFADRRQMAETFLESVDFGNNNWVRAGGYDIPYYESRRVQTVQQAMGIEVTGWYDDRTGIAVDTLQTMYKVNNANSGVFGRNTWNALEKARSSAWDFHQFQDEYKGNVAHAQLMGLIGDLAVNAAIFGGGKALLSRLLPEAAALTETSAAVQTTALVPYYPANDGFLSTTFTELKPGMLIDRYGRITGSFASPVGTPLEMRALPYNSVKTPYGIYEVVKPVKVLAGPATPAFGQIGMGTQYKFFLPIEDLIDAGILRKVGP
jgi:RHS repeat-associated protein